MQRLLTTTVLVGLLVATAAAFAVTERLKLTKSAVYGTHVSKAFSPLCSCARGHANVRIILRRRDTLTVSVVRGRTKQVALLVAGEPHPRGEARFRWNGRTDAGTLAPDGAYYVRIHLEGQHQTIVLPNKILLDTKPPQVKNVTVNRDEFSPDGDGQADFVRLSYQLSKPAHVVVYLGKRRILVTNAHKTAGSVSWYGDAHGQTLPQGDYTLDVGALDLAGNSTPVAQRWRVHVRIRFIELASKRIVVRAGRRLEIGVSTDAVGYTWKLGRRSAFATGPVLRLRAPDRRGRYTLTVSEHGHVSRAAVFVR